MSSKRGLWAPISTIPTRSPTTGTLADGGRGRFCAGLSPMPAAVAGELAGAIFGEVGHIPGVIGDAATAASFAGRWSELAGGQVTPEEGQRDDEGPCCAARTSFPIAGVCRIGIVYTPPERRRRGYAAALVGAVSAWVGEYEGAECMLYTQLANATSNGIYRRLGYEAAAEVLRYRFQMAG